MAKGGPLRGFTLAGADKIFHPANAVIAGKTVLLTSKKVSKPVAVRYGWAPIADGNLFNKAQLPASPFRSDVERPRPRPDRPSLDASLLGGRLRGLLQPLATLGGRPQRLAHDTEPGLHDR